jgi:hypothetical protein
VCEIGREEMNGSMRDEAKLFCQEISRAFNK